MAILDAVVAGLVPLIPAVGEIGFDAKVNARLQREMEKRAEALGASSVPRSRK